MDGGRDRARRGSALRLDCVHLTFA